MKKRDKITTRGGYIHMKVIKINVSNVNAYSSIKNSMEEKEEISICNNLDACGCTGNGYC